MLQNGNIYNLTKKGRSEHVGLRQIIYIKKIDNTYSLVANVSNNPQILLGYLTYKKGTTKIYIDCRALYKVETKHIIETLEVDVCDKQQVISGIYDLFDRVKRTKTNLIESNRGIKQKIKILIINNGNTSELLKKYNQQKKVIQQLHINQIEMHAEYRNESKYKIDHNNYYTRFKEVPSVYVKFYRG